jgi:hypothetical protein
MAIFSRFSKPEIRSSAAALGWAWLWAFACASVNVQAVPDEPAPFRRLSLIDGRGVLYDEESFVHRFHYRFFPASVPAAGEDGLAGSAGSVSSDEQFSVGRVQDTLNFDEGGLLSYRILREENLSGRYDRQLFGLGFKSGNWDNRVYADGPGDKAEFALQFETRWQAAPNRRVRWALMLPDVMFNRKTAEQASYAAIPAGVFTHVDWLTESAWRWQWGVNANPEVSFTHTGLRVDFDAAQIETGIEVSTPRFALGRWTLAGGLEQVRADYQLRLTNTVPEQSYRRQFREGRLIWEFAPDVSWRPQVGFRYLRLREQGWMGLDALDAGIHYRREAMFFAAFEWQVSSRTQLTPLLSVSRIRVVRQMERSDIDERDDRLWFSKLSLPWRFTVNRAQGGMISLDPSFFLHELKYGGGNLQVQWHF